MNNVINFLSTKVFSAIWKAVQAKIYKLIIQEGSSRSSKTWSNFQVLFLYLYSNPFTTCTILRDTQKSCRDIVEIDWIKWLSDPMGRKKELEDGKITIHEFDKFIREENLLKFFLRNKTNHTWTFLHNNSFIRFTGLDDENDAMGMTQDICWINEPYNFSKEVFLQLSQRTSKFILFDWNPKQNHWVTDEKRKNNTITLKSTFLDNPFCPEESKKQILSYQPVKHSDVVVSGLISELEIHDYNLDENKLCFTKKQINEIKRCLYNESVNSASEYHWLVFGLGLKSEKPNKIFKNWRQLSLEDFDKLPYNSYYGLDFGLSSPCGLVEMKFDKRSNIFYFHQHLYKGLNFMKGTLSQELLNLGIDKRKEIVVDTGNELNKNEAGKLLNSGFNVIGAKKGKGSIISGIETLQKKEVYYTKESLDIENEYDVYSWREVQGIVLNEPEESPDHLLDAMKYVAVWYTKTYRID